MSVKHFYQTLYQGDQLFRLDERMFSGINPEYKGAIPAATEPVAGMVQPELSEPVTVVEPVTIAAPVVMDVITPEPVSVRPVTVPDAAPEPVPMPTPVVRVQPTPVIVKAPDAAPVPQPPVAQPAPAVINQKVLILADEELTASDLLFLEKILKAVNLNLDGVELMNLHRIGHIDFADVLRGKYIHHFITFGVPFRRIGLDIMMDRYQPVRFEGISFLMADSLPTVEADQNLKRALWHSLKRVFSL
ncbi:hypothetical protein [Arsenicibacter rosenii]|uniref:Uncharacterized protein n=1 Tax=Arsenicibacter rosenii TaxID=1750698 RepID=A0A1S2VFC0_9BACT|nr:hypothetical protein [Arsenicibacter rosenii]OIN57457.1 hypothetical protein BLX24_19705 [Arsenicibacter rosenii]